MECKVVQHSELSEDLLFQIIAIKKKSWTFDDESQINWIKKNIESKDEHFMLFDDGLLVAYLNIVRVQVKINGEDIWCYGIGNVCARDKGVGGGSLIMKELNSLMLLRNSIGFLLCKQNLVSFYKKNAWVEYSVNLGENVQNIIAMFYNLAPNDQDIEYNGRFF